MLKLETLSCSICLQSYQTTDNLPFCLPCGHTFCQKCIQGLIQPQCPVDRQIFQKNNVQKNFNLIAVIEELSKIRLQPPPVEPLRLRSPPVDIPEIQIEPIVSVMCKVHHKGLTKYCLKCFNVMCAACKCKHKTPGSENIISIQEMRRTVEYWMRTTAQYSAELNKEEQIVMKEVDEEYDKILALVMNRERFRRG